MVFNNIFSVPVHERTEVVIDLMLNVRRFCPDSAVVMHISKGFNYRNSAHSAEQFRSILATFDNVFVNPTSLDTRWGDIVHTHVSNFKYASTVADFKYFSLIASNELFVREMHTLLPDGFDVGFVERVFADHPEWVKGWYPRVWEDEYFDRILKHFGATYDNVFRAVSEGNVYSKDIFTEIVGVLDQFYSVEAIANRERVIYPREEVYIQTIAHLVDKNLRNANVSFTNWNLNKKPLKLSIITDTAEGKLDGKYSVKRVARVLDDVNRVYIGEKLGGYRDQTLSYVDRS